MFQILFLKSLNSLIQEPDVVTVSRDYFKNVQERNAGSTLDYYKRLLG